MLPQGLDAWLAHWQSVHAQPIAMGLERVAEVARRLRLEKPAPISIAVGGTNGKGSVVAFLDAMLRASDRVVGSYTSPHLLAYNERVRIDGEPVDDAELIAAFRRIEKARDGIQLTYFESGTLAALDVFQAREVDVAVLEVGMGGRLDAVNLVDADAAVLTTVDLDHQEWLGADREAIGGEKAGIFRSGRPAVIGDVQPPASVLAHIDAIGAHGVRAGVDFFSSDAAAGWRFSHRDGSSLQLPAPTLRGEIQRHNAAIAIATLHALRDSLPVAAAAFTRGVANARIAGRLQVVAGAPETIVDVGHNPQAARALAQWLSRAPQRRTVAIFSALADKDIAGIVEPLRGLIDRWWAIGLAGDTPRGLDAARMAERVATCGVDCRTGESMQEALAAARTHAGPGGRVIVFGSFYTVAAAMRALGLRSS